MKLKDENNIAHKSNILKRNNSLTKISKETKRKSAEIHVNQITRYFAKKIINTVDLTTVGRDISTEMKKETVTEPPQEEIIKIKSNVDETSQNIANVRVEGKILNIFPFISHVQQACDVNIYSSYSRNILRIVSEELPNNLVPKFSLNMEKTENVLKERSIHFNMVRNIKSAINEIKKNNPNFPVNKVYKKLCTQSGKNQKSSRNGIIRQHDSLMWTEKYKPANTDDIIGQSRIVNEITKWLENFQNDAKSEDSSSEAEFDIGDCDRTSETSIENTIILDGPTGCGKSCLVYAVCKEFGYDVLEINASSLRTGKKLMQELREATQSYQVNKNKNPIFKPKKSKVKPDKKLKVCMIFIEDIDIVFDEDDGFLSSLAQLATTTKCPIILTTNNKKSMYVQQFMNQRNCKLLTQQYPKNISIWLQILCLVEGFVVQDNEINTLLQCNKWDIRQCLLELQYLIESEDNTGKETKLMFGGDLGSIWWNFFKMFNYKELKLYDQISDYLSVIETLSSKCIVEPVLRHWTSNFTDSLELNEDKHSFDDPIQYKDLFHVLLDSCTSNSSQVEVDMFHAEPSIENIRWRTDVHKSVQALEECVELSNYMDRKAVALDYLPALRNIARSEQFRYTNNNKRGNRFRHYFKELTSFHFNDDLYKSVCGLMNR